MMMYYHKLKDNIKNEFMHDEHMINNMNEFMKTTIEIDNKLYKKIMK